MHQKFTDNAEATLASSITAGSTTLSVQAGKGALFPSCVGSGTAGDALHHFVVTLEDGAGNIEKIKVEHRSTDSFGSGGYPLIRGYDGTTARAWNAGDVVALRAERSALNQFSDWMSGIFGGRGQALSFGWNPSTTTGLNYGYFGGVIATGSTTYSVVAGGTIALTDSATNYVERTEAGVVSKNTTSFTGTLIPMAVVVVSGGAITDVTDARPILPAVIGNIGHTAVRRGAAGAITVGTVTCTAVSSTGDVAGTSGTFTGGAVTGATCAFTSTGSFAGLLTLTGAWGGSKGALSIEAGAPSIVFQDTTDNRKWMHYLDADAFYIYRAATLGAGATDWAARMTLDASGNVTFAGNVTINSDIRLKENLQQIRNATDKVRALTGYTFNRKDWETDARQAGLIAQHVQAVLPEAVSEQKDEAGTLGVALSGVIALLVEAVKEIDSRLTDIERKLQ